MNILLTGATGYLGSHLARALIGAGHRVSCLKRSFSDTRRIDDLLDSMTAYDIDNTPIPGLLRALRGLDAVVHSATCYGRKPGEVLADVVDANVSFPLRLLEAATRENVPKFINIDTSIRNPVNPYALSKRQFREWGLMLSRQGRPRFLNIRFEHFFGPGDDETKFTTHVIRSCRRNVPRLEFTPGEQLRDFIYIDDAVSAFRLIFESEMGSDSIENEEFEIGSGEAVTIKDFAATVRRLTGASTRLDFGALPYRENEVMFSQADTSRLTALGWRNETGIEAGILKTLEGEQAT